MHTTNSILMIRPIPTAYLAHSSMPNTALAEFNHLAFQLRMNDIDIHLFDDTLEPEKPDAIFPNNWISTNDSFCRQYASTGKQIKQQPVSAIRTSICITP